MAGNLLKVTLDTNILISAIGFGGKPRKILQLVLDKKILAITSLILIAELEDVVSKKFPKLANNFIIITKQLEEQLQIVRPVKSLKIVRDDPDNRILEAALEGQCQYIITGDKELLTLGLFKGIKILSASDFLEEVELTHN